VPAVEKRTDRGRFMNANVFGSQKAHDPPKPPWIAAGATQITRFSWPASAAVVDALAITSAAAGWNAHEHYDALYAPHDGHVSRTIANVVLNTICAAHMPAARRHPS